MKTYRNLDININDIKFDINNLSGKNVKVLTDFIVDCGNIEMKIKDANAIVFGCVCILITQILGLFQSTILNSIIVVIAGIVATIFILLSEAEKRKIKERLELINSNLSSITE